MEPRAALGVTAGGGYTATLKKYSRKKKSGQPGISLFAGWAECLLGR